MTNNIITNKEKNYLYFKKLNENNIINLFTTKPFNFNRKLIPIEKIDKQINELEQTINHKFNKIIMTNQNHTDNIICITKENLNNTFENVDGLITNLKNIALITFLADCQAIYLYDKENKVIANIHSGWRGTLKRIVIKAIDIMKNNYNSNPKNIEVYINPSILNCCFEVEEDVKKIFEEEFKDININTCIQKVKTKNNKPKYYIDTININKQILLNIGILKENITLSNICTKCNHNTYHSYRKDKKLSGRNIALISLK